MSYVGFSGIKYFWSILCKLNSFLFQNSEEWFEDDLEGDEDEEEDNVDEHKHLLFFVVPTQIWGQGFESFQDNYCQYNDHNVM